ncbi:MAG: PhzF family phenazine biosynthesis protein [Ignavibacteriae bacterium]|nr:PhzF family phenazine biosynthesis protein [Ignavibacteriota bacterium]NOG99037.1 PhzF family phenazine biosynthesis protein [Ignavibacteriota bacterium]
MKLPIYQVDAFTSKVFGGNPAAVIPLEEWIDEKILQNIALENNLSETAFFVEENSGYKIRWFTPTAEVDLCGHATLASAYVLFNHLNFNKDILEFNSRSGKLIVEKDNSLISLNFPARVPKEVDKDKILIEALGVEPDKILFNKTLVAVYSNENIVRQMKPDIRKFLELETHGVIITAPGNRVDFVSRFFAPDVGIDEDPVTGYAHTLLAPFWAEELNKTKLTALQVSKRGGELFCEIIDDRVIIKGEGKLYMKGEIEI